jgi:hypothetical protein
MDRRLGGRQSRSGRFGEEKILDHTGTRTTLVGNTKEKRPLARPGNRWMDIIKMNIREERWGGMNLIDMEGPRGHGSEPWGSVKCWQVLEWLHNWRLLEKDSAP